MEPAHLPAGAALRWRLRGESLSLDRPILMGILNLTPDSFSDGGLYQDAGACRRRVEAMVQEGADLIDVGGESTRPGARTVSPGEEWERVEPGVRAALAAGARVSVDTSKSAVARRALDLGAHLINDVTAFGDPGMSAVVREFNAGVVLMHMQGTPRNMQKQPHYHDPVGEIRDFLQERRAAAEAAGIAPEAVALDPGIGFGKTLEHNLTVLRSLHHFTALGCPVVLGVSRKRFIGELTGVTDARERTLGSVAAAVFARTLGVQVFRVHDVAATRQALTVADALASG